MRCSPSSVPGAGASELCRTPGAPGNAPGRWSAADGHRDDAAPQPADRGADHRRHGVLGDLADLVEQVDELARPADEVAAGELGARLLGAGEHPVEALPVGPAVGGPGEAEIEVAGHADAVVGLDVVQAQPDAAHLADGRRDLSG